MSYAAVGVLDREVKLPFQTGRTGIQPKSQTGAYSPLARYGKVLMGLPIVFGLSGIVFWRKGRKIQKNQRST